MKNNKTMSSKPFSPDAKVVKIHTESRLPAIIKTGVLLLLIAAQFVIMILLYLDFVTAWRWYTVFAVVMTLLTCIYVLSAEKSGQSKAVWILFLVVSFGFGFIVYFISDERFTFAAIKRRYREMFKRTEKYDKPLKIPEGVKTAVRSDCQYLYNAGKFPVYTGTDLKYFPSGAQTFDDVLIELERAEKFIFIEFFIVAAGILLKRITDILYRKINEGVDVRLIIDGFGSHGTLSWRAKNEMKKAGVKMAVFNRILPYFNVAQSYRDHRKIISIDGKVAYTGGVNLADEYINEKRMYGYWKDSGLRVKGSAVDGLTLSFLRQWEYLTGSKEDYEPYFNNYEKCGNTSVVVPYADGVEYAAHICKTVYSNIIAGAHEKLYIMTPYFIPDDTIIEQLSSKAQSGVDVRLIIPAIPDKKFAYFLTRNNAEKLIASGVKVYRMKESFVHSKIVLSENCVSVCSVNMDMRSFYQQFEIGVYTDDEDILKSVQNDFKETFVVSEQTTPENMSRRNLLRRIISGALQIFAPLM